MCPLKGEKDLNCKLLQEKSIIKTYYDFDYSVFCLALLVMRIKITFEVHFKRILPLPSTIYASKIGNTFPSRVILI